MLADPGLLLIRLVVGLLFIGHGLQKLAGWFGGAGLGGTGGWLESLGLRPGRFWAFVAGAAEVVGGALFALGLFVPVSALLLTAVMATAIARVHAPRGLWIDRGGYEYNLVLATTALGVALVGPGAYALDTVWEVSLPVLPILGWGLVAIVVLEILLAARVRTPQATAQA